jgi:hypothetical protein
MAVCNSYLDRASDSTYSSGVRKTLLTFLSLILCSISLYGSKDQPCHETFQFKAEPIKRIYAKGERVTIRLSFTNSTSHDVYIVPYLFPSDYWVDKHGDGRWITLSTGISGPNAKERPAGSTDPAQPSEYRRILAGETFTTQFDVELSSITKLPVGKFRLGSVHAHIHANDSALNNYGCFIFAPQSATFTVR